MNEKQNKKQIKKREGNLKNRRHVKAYFKNGRAFISGSDYDFAFLFSIHVINWRQNRTEIPNRPKD